MLDGTKQLKSSNAVHSLGFIAQDMHEIIPEVVSVPKDPNDLWSVDYTRLVPVLVKSIQEQQEQIEMLQEEVFEKKNLEDQLLRLTQRMNVLESQINEK